MNIADVNTTVSQLSAADRKEVEGIVEYWKQSFLRLKTLDMEIVCAAEIANGTDAKNLLTFQGKFVYDAPNYYTQVQFADSKGILGDVNIVAFDGHHYWGQTTDAGQKTIIKYTKDPSPSLPFGGNPLIYQFRFVFDTYGKETLSALRKDEVWKSFLRRIVRVEKQLSDGKEHMVLHVENQKDSGRPNEPIHEFYQVNVVPGDTPFPSSWKMTTTQQKGMRFEIDVSETKIFSQNSLHFAFPIRVATLAYQQNTLIDKYIIEIPVNSLKINQPIDPAIFSIRPDKDIEIINGDEINKTAEKGD